MSKQCTKCGKTKPVSEFNSSNPTSDGYNSWCKQCCRKASKEYRESSIGIYAQIKGRITYALNHQDEKHNGYSRGTSELKISRNEFVGWYDSQPKKCAYCDLPESYLDDVDDLYIQRTVRLTIDRIDNDKDYELGNLVLSCKRCNALKSDFFDYETFREIAQKYIKPVWEKRLGFVF